MRSEPRQAREAVRPSLSTKASAAPRAQRKTVSHPHLREPARAPRERAALAGL